ncbi:SET domain-containing protein [Piedraia hortae CBS 480.64]|uniref:SET domain-containing protein n=1 Tax=Piedraia hortae CBS 480.64 TaxID=1314780 RepID=A0A6A7C0C3_9PEZI|nr:SET domain-containing protein [Piedraia hortae CBS 480.64]
MKYECTPKDCKLRAEQWGDRPFAELVAHLKRGTLYSIGVQVILMSNRGYGISACRKFSLVQLIIEYIGRIVTEDECQRRRMLEEYQTSSSHYFMEFGRGLVINAMRSNMAYFNNHSCTLNAVAKKVTVNGRPRLGIFAGDDWNRWYVRIKMDGE